MTPIMSCALSRSTFGANNKTYVPQVFEADGGGGGGSSFGDGCDPGTFFTIAGNLISPHLPLSLFTILSTALHLFHTTCFFISILYSLFSYLSRYQIMNVLSSHLETTIQYLIRYLRARTLY